MLGGRVNSEFSPLRIWIQPNPERLVTEAVLALRSREEPEGQEDMIRSSRLLYRQIVSE